ncbi:MAG: OmpA family protein [Gammaproteobacteria bacterium]
MTQFKDAHHHALACFSERLATLSLLILLAISPAAMAASDSDGDGVSNRADQCPSSNASASVDARGCEFDSDGDGVVDHHDECPDSTTGVAANIRGCAHDSDGDQVVDFRDACPNTDKGVNVDATGCPLGDALQLPGLKFAQGSSTLNRRARAVLDRAANTLEKYPDLRIEVAGYTDSQGDAGSNRKLSQQRAEAVRRYLETIGINRSRLSARGYGEQNPIASNNSAAGRAINRRVVLKLGRR